MYVLVSIELGTRRVHLGGWSDLEPDSVWVSQQARNLAMPFQEGRDRSPRFVIHDRDTKFTDSFDEVFRSDGMRILLTPIRLRTPTPSANYGWGRFGRMP